jgi:uncharacterized protein (TIGR02996 family)
MAPKTTSTRTSDVKTTEEPSSQPEITSLLERAAAGKDPLEQLLAAWAIVPAEEIAEAIERVPREDLEPIVAGTAVEGLARLTRLDTARDPRVSATYVRWLAAPPWHATGSRPFYTSLFKRLLAIGDPRALAQLPKAAKQVEKTIKGASMRGWLVEAIGKACAALAKAPPVLSAGDRALVTQAANLVATAPRSAPKVSKATQAAAELLAAIRANPADDGARQVYADILSEKGDPRGEFITMQLARSGREPTSKERGRELAFLRKHLRVWLGELSAVSGALGSWNVAVGPGFVGWDIRFERGFLAEVMARGSDAKIRSVAGHPDFATVECLLAEDPALLVATELPALELLATSSQALPVVLERPFASQLVELHVRTRELGSDLALAIRGCGTLPKLRRMTLEFYAAQFDDLLASTLAAALALPRLEKVGTSFYACEGAYERIDGRWRFTCAPRSRPGERVLEQLVALTR